MDIIYADYQNFFRKDGKINKSYKKLLLSINDGMEIKYNFISEDLISPKKAEKLIRTIFSAKLGKALIKQEEKNEYNTFLLKLTKSQQEYLDSLKSQFQN